MPSKEQVKSGDQIRAKHHATRSAAQNVEGQAQEMIPAGTGQKAERAPELLTPRDVLQLQRPLGNQVVRRLLAQPLIQREVDTSSSPFLPTYEKGEVPGWKDEGGVAEWAKEEYWQESKRTVICSMTPDGKKRFPSYMPRSSTLMD